MSFFTKVIHQDDIINVRSVFHPGLFRTAFGTRSGTALMPEHKDFAAVADRRKMTKYRNSVKKVQNAGNIIRRACAPNGYFCHSIKGSRNERNDHYDSAHVDPRRPGHPIHSFYERVQPPVRMVPQPRNMEPASAATVHRRQMHSLRKLHRSVRPTGAAARRRTDRRQPLHLYTLRPVYRGLCVGSDDACRPSD